VEAASVPRPRRRRPPRRRSHAAALAALVVYTAFGLAAYLLIARALDGDDTRSGSQAPGTATLAPGPDQLALQAVGSRAQRSTVGVGSGTGFVAWQSNGLTLVLTSRPRAGWRTGEARSLAVAYGSEQHDGTLVRTDRRTGLGLVRVGGPVGGEPLWQTLRDATVRPGEPVVLVGRSDSSTAAVDHVAPRRIFLRGAGYGALAGGPVLNASGRLIGVVDAGGGVVPIERACGVIRRC
jgi:hypothetical protein